MEPNNERTPAASKMNSLKSRSSAMRHCAPQIPKKKKPVSSILKRSLSINPPCSTNALPRAKQNAKPHSRRRQNRRLLVLPQSR